MHSHHEHPKISGLDDNLIFESLLFYQSLFDFDGFGK